MAIITGTPVSDLLTGTDNGDALRGLEGDDAILGNGGDDQIDGGAGNDSLNGNKGNDSLFGGNGNDSQFGGQGNDLIIGEGGNDFLAGDAGINTLIGGAGRDTYVVAPGGTAIVNDFAPDEFIGLTAEISFDQIAIAQGAGNSAGSTLIIDTRTNETLATLQGVNSNNLTAANFLTANGVPVVPAPTIVPIVDVTTTDPIATAGISGDPIVFTVSRTNNIGGLVVNFTINTAPGLAIQQVPASVLIPPGLFSANVVVTPQSTSNGGDVSIALQPSSTYNVRNGVALGTVTAAVAPPTAVPQPDPPAVPTVVDLVLTRTDTPNPASFGQNVTSTFTVTNRGTRAADRVFFTTSLPVDSNFVSATPSQGSFNGFTGGALGGDVGVELGTLAPDASATITVIFAPQTIGESVITNASVTTAQVDVDPTNNFANARFTVIPSAPVLPTVTIAAPTAPAVESDTTVQENQGAVAQNFTITRSGGDLTQPLTVTYQISGTAQNTVDFEPIGSTVTFAPFETTRTVRILPVQDRQVEEDEAVTLTLVPNPLVYDVGTVGAATINIEDVPNPTTPDPLPAVVSIVAIDQFAEEPVGGQGSASGSSKDGSGGDSSSGGSNLLDAQSDSPRRGVFRISRDNSIGNLEVNLEVTGNAVASDYTLSTSTTVNGVSELTVIPGINTITIPDGAQFIDLIVTATGDTLREGFEDVVVNVAPGVGYQIGRPQDVASDNPAFVRIRDNDTPPNVSISTVDGIGDELGNTITFRVSRNGDLSGARAVLVELPRDFTIGADPDGAGPLTGAVTLDPDTAGRPRQIQRNGAFDSDGEDYDVTGTNVFLGLSTLTSNAGASVANLSQFPPDVTSNRFLVIIPEGRSFTDVVVTPINDRVTETVESVVARIVPPPLPESASGIIPPSDIPPGGFIVTGGAAEAFILDSDATQALLLEATDPTAIEGGDDAVLTITRNGPTSEPLPVTLTAVTAEFRIQPLILEGSSVVPSQAEFTNNVLPALPIPPSLTIPAGSQFVDIELGVVRILRIGGDLDISVQLRLGRTGDPSIPLTVTRTLVEQIGAVTSSASLGIDYDLPDSIVIPVGEDSVTVSIDALLDQIVEGTENFGVIAGTNPGFRVIGQPAIFTIQDADAVQTLSIASTATAAEGGADGQFTITRTGNTSTPLDVTVVLANQTVPVLNPDGTPALDANGNPVTRQELIGTATPGTDFVPIPTRVTIPAGASSVTVPVQAIDDGVPESAIETVILELQPQTNFVIGANRATVGIADRTVATLTVNATNPAIAEGTAAGGAAEFTFTRTALPNATTPEAQFPARTFSFILSGTAQNGIDFSPLSGQVTFATGANTATIQLATIADALFDNNETVTVTLEPETVASGGYVVVGLPATVTITDTTPSISIEGTDPIASELTFDTAVFTVRRTGSTTNAVTIPFTITPTGTTVATPGVDFLVTPPVNFGTQPQGEITIPAGADSAQITVFPIDDLTGEGVEQFTITVAAPPGLGLGNASVNGFVTDDAVNVSFFPGTPANDRLVGTAEVDNAPGNDLLIGGAGNDVIAGNTGDDTIDGGPGDDDLRGNLGAQNAGLGDPGSSDDDSIIGGAGDDTIDGEIGNDTLVGGSGNDIIFATRFGTAEPQRDNGPISDTVLFNSPNEGIDRIVSFLPNSFINREPIDNNPDVDGTQTFPLGAEDSVVNDIIALVNNAAAGDFDGLTVTGGPIVAAQFQSADGEANIPANSQARILYDAATGRLFYVPTGITTSGSIPADATLFAVFESSPALAVNSFRIIGDANVVAPNSPVVTIAAITQTSVEGGTDGLVRITRTGATANSLTVFVGLTGTAQNGVDFTPISDGITIPAGSSTVDVPLDALTDSLLEGTETAVFTILPNTGYTVGAANTTTLQIQDANALGTLTIATTAVNTTEGSATPGSVTITRTGSTASPLDVPITIGGTATNGVDFIQIPSTVTIPAGQASLTVNVTALIDNNIEGTETVSVALSSVSGFNIGSPPAQVTIQDANALGTLTIAATTVNTTEGSATPGSVTITRTGSTASPLDVPITIGGTATNGVDFIQIPSTVTIPAGQASFTVNVTALTDNSIEGTETVSVALSNVSGFNIGSPPAQVTIQDANALGTLTIAATTVNTTEGSATPGSVTITRTGSTASPLDVPITIGGTATNGVDFIQIPSTVTIPAGQASFTVNVTALTDNNIEGTETVSVALSNVSGFNIGSPPAVLNIFDAATPPIDDLLTGDPNSNILNGGAGNDTLAGGAGIDTLIGGTGADLFVFNEAGIANADALTDFSIADNDRIRLLRSAGGGNAFPGNIDTLTNLATAGSINVLGNASSAFSSFLRDGVNDPFGAPNVPTYAYDSTSGRFLVDADGTAPTSLFTPIATLPINLTPTGSIAEVTTLFNQISISL